MEIIHLIWYSSLKIKKKHFYEKISSHLFGNGIPFLYVHPAFVFLYLLPVGPMTGYEDVVVEDLPFGVLSGLRWCVLSTCYPSRDQEKYDWLENQHVWIGYIYIDILGVAPSQDSSGKQRSIGIPYTKNWIIVKKVTVTGKGPYIHFHVMPQLSYTDQVALNHQWSLFKEKHTVSELNLHFPLLLLIVATNSKSL